MNEPLSIIVPCLNEELYIGTLLSCLARQSYQNFEVLVIDGNSSDGTQGAVEGSISSHTQLSGKVRFVMGDKKGVAHQRNFGVGLAAHHRLLFLDADVQIPDSFLVHTLGEIGRLQLDVATTIFDPISERVDDRFFYYLGNIYIQLKQFIQPVAMGFCIFSTKAVHKALQGFDQEVMPGEDFDYVKRAAKLGVEFKVVTKDRAYVSIRRLKKEGRLTYYYKALLLELLGLVMDPKEASKAVEYKFDN